MITGSANSCRMVLMATLVAFCTICRAGSVESVFVATSTTSQFSCVRHRLAYLSFRGWVGSGGMDNEFEL